MAKREAVKNGLERQRLIVVGADVLAFGEDITLEQRGDILNASLLAQLVAKERVLNPNALADWYKEYFDSLSQVGLVFHGTTNMKSCNATDNLEVQEAILGVAAEGLVDSPRSLAMVKAIFKSLQTLPSTSPPMALFNRESCSANTARFRLILVDKDEHGRHLVTLMAFGIEAQKTLTQLLSLKLNKREAGIYHYVGQVPMVPTLSAAVRDQMANKLAAFSTNYISGIPVLGSEGVRNGSEAADPLTELPAMVNATMKVDRLDGEATNVEIDEMSSGQVDATTIVQTVTGNLTGVKIGTLGSTRVPDMIRSTTSGSGQELQELIEKYFTASQHRENASNHKTPAKRTSLKEFSTTTANVHVDRVDRGQVIGSQVNRRDGDRIQGDQVNVASGGQASNHTGFSGSVKINGPVTIIQGPTGSHPHANTGSTVNDSLTIEEKIRLDVALPKNTLVNEPFDVVIAVKQPDAPVLAVTDLDQVVSGDGSVIRSEADDVVKYRVEVTGADVEVIPKSYVIELRPKTNSRPIAFQVVSSKKGRRSLIVNAYQENEALVAQTRVTIEVVIAVSTN